MDQIPVIKSVKFDKEKHLPRNIEEKVSDQFFLLLTIFIGERKGLKVNRLNLQKALFLSKFILENKGIKFLNTGFYKYLHGPYQKRLQFTTESLSSYGLIEKEQITGTDIVLTNKGISFLNLALQKMKKNEAFEQYIEVVSDCLSEFSGEKAGKSIDFTHSLKVKIGDKTKTLHEMPDTEKNYLELVEKKEIKSVIKAPSEAITNLINFRAYFISQNC